ncbi:PREDICTED: endogenous retrovirus group V member 2 Env polyprotein-like [Miniopterus natalensis]|uniref:endogenous retrovirus group V member 2 Env polyprotein-like n=1 Tax=Miniopterus natalensis TaxID=291302 RepID=UPI0007A6C963|nr:PREDICTED: endogenous retrovirus group V member 2 Env polyprotein-like [Miniopterus natalensis]
MQICDVLCVLSLFWSFTLAGDDNSLARISQSIAFSSNLSHYWICHLTPSSLLDHSDPLVLPVLNFSQIPSYQVTYDMKFPNVVHRVRLVDYEFPVPCFFLTPPENFPAMVSGKSCKKPDAPGQGNLTRPSGSPGAPWQYNRTCFTDPASLPLIRQRCANLSSAYASTKLCRTWRGQDETYLKGSPTPLQSCHMTPSWTLPRTDPWLENILGHLPQGDNLNFQNMTGILCAPMGYVFVCGSQNEAWAYKCLDSWRIGGTCLLGYLITPFSETVHWTSSLKLFTRIARDLPDGDSYFFGYIFLPWLDVVANQRVLRNLSKTLDAIANEMATTLTGLQTSLNSLAEVVLDNRVALDYMLAEQGGVCIAANTTCCTYISSSSEVDTHIAKIRQQATLFQPKVDPQSGHLGGIQDWFTGLFSWKLKGAHWILGSILKLGLIVLLTAMLFIMIMYCVIKRCANKAKTTKINREMPMATF